MLSHKSSWTRAYYNIWCVIFVILYFIVVTWNENGQARMKSHRFPAHNRSLMIFLVLDELSPWFNKHINELPTIRQIELDISQ